MRYKNILFVLLILISFIALNAKEWEYFKCINNHFSDVPGALVGSGLYITSVATDITGNRWLRTDSSFFEYDGINFNKYLIPDSINKIPHGTDIYFDKESDLVMLPYTVLIHKNNKWYLFTEKETFIDQSFIRNIAFDNQNNYWVSSDTGLYKYDGSKWFLYNKKNSPLPSNKIINIKVDKNNAIWIGTNLGLVKLKDSIWTIYNVFNSGLIANNVNPLAVDRNNNLYLNVGENNFMSYDGTNWKILDMSSIGLSQVGCRGIMVDSKNNKWFGTDSGLVKFDGTNFKLIGRPPLLSDKSNHSLYRLVMDISIDSSDNIWMSYDVQNFGAMLVAYQEGGLVNVVNQYPFLDVYETPNNANPNLQISQGSSSSAFLLKYKLDKPGYADYQIFNMLGTRVIEKSLGCCDSGANEIEYDGSGLSPGIYLCVLRAGGNVLVKKFLVVK